MGPSEALDAFNAFCDMVEQAFKKDPSFDGEAFHRKFGELNYLFCYEVHGEKSEPGTPFEPDRNSRRRTDGARTADNPPGCIEPPPYLPAPMFSSTPG